MLTVHAISRRSSKVPFSYVDKAAQRCGPAVSATHNGVDTVRYEPLDHGYLRLGSCAVAALLPVNLRSR